MSNPSPAPESAPHLPPPLPSAQLPEFADPHGPVTLNYGQPTINLRKVATRQRAVIFCLLARVLFVILVAAFAPPGPQPLLMLAGFAIDLASAVAVILLAITVYPNSGPGIVMGILALIPLVGVIPLLIVNGKATKTLRYYGHKVGLFGARMSELPPA